MGLTLQRSFSETQLLTILNDFRENRAQNFLTESLQISKVSQPEEDPFMPKDNFSFPRLAKLENAEYYNEYYESILKPDRERPVLPVLDFSKLNNNNDDSSSDILADNHYIDQNGVKIFVPRIANKLNSSGSPTTLRMVALRRSQAQPSALGKEQSPNTVNTPKSPLVRSSSSQELKFY